MAEKRPRWVDWAVGNGGERKKKSLFFGGAKFFPELEEEGSLRLKSGIEWGWLRVNRGREMG